MSNEQWYYARNGERFGPVPAEALRAMASSGQLEPRDVVWCEGMNTWAPAGTVPGVFPMDMPAGGMQPSYGSAPQPIQYYAAPQYPTHPGFWLRVAASILDALVLWIPNAALTAGAQMALDGTLTPPRVTFTVVQKLSQVLALYRQIFFTRGRVTAWVLGVLLGWLYAALMESSSNQGTLGKMAVGIRVCDDQGNRVSFARATVRHFAKIISGLPTLMIGFMMAGWTEKKQALHDKVAGCLMFKKT